MSSTSIAPKRLIWKELRQSLPLIGVSVVITAVLYFIVLLNNLNGMNVQPVEVWLLGLPGLFAVGIGAILVGQEKEQRTIQWLQSLPISKRDLINSKLIASLIGLAALWVVSLILVTVFTGGEYWSAGNQLPIVGLVENSSYCLLVFAQSLYLLLAGMAISWRVKSAFMALLLLVPFAVLPTVLTGVYSEVARQTEFVGLWPFFTSVLACSAVASYLGWHFAWRALQPASGRKLAPPKAAVLGNLGLPYSQFSALLWQFTRQNRRALVGILSLFILAMVLMSMNTPPGAAVNAWSIATLVGSSGILAVLATSWLGVLVFQSDRQNRRIRFLADRGVSPNLTWISRHAIPLCILVGCLMLVVLSSTRIVSYNSMYYWAEFVSLLVIPASLVALTTYSVSQWIGQILNSPILSGVAAPIASVAAIMYSLFSLQTVGAPVLLVLFASLLPILATRILMRRWMNDRRDIFYWSTHAAAITLFFLLPAMPLVYAWLRSPTMSAATEAAMDDHLQQHSAQVRSPSFITIKLPGVREPSPPKDESGMGLGDAEMGDTGMFGPGIAVEAANEGEVGLSGAAEVAQHHSAPSKSEATEAIAPSLEVVASNSTEENSETTQSATPTDGPSMMGMEGTAPVLEEMTIEQRSDLIRSGILLSLDSSDGPISTDIRLVQWLRTEMMILRLNIDEKSESSSASDVSSTSSPNAAKRFQDVILLAVRIVERLRLSPRLNDQEMADRLEIVLVSELQRAKIETLLDETSQTIVANVIGGKRARNNARRTAIAETWRLCKAAQASGQESFMAQVINRNQAGFNLIDFATQRGRAATTLEVLWHLTDPQLASLPQSHPESLRAQLAAALNVSQTSYGLGARGKFLRADDTEMFLYESTDTIRGISFGSQWNAAWELQAEQLSKKMIAAKSVSTEK
jgi:ABC-type transport system involved in multi-copper enzyme maturation permease subunit